MAKTTTMIAPGGQRHTPSTKPRRLSSQTEAQVREMIARPGFAAPTMALLMLEIDATRAELSAALARAESAESQLDSIIRSPQTISVV